MGKGLNTELDNIQSNKKKAVLPNLSGGAQLTINGDFCAMLNTLKSNIIMNGGASDNFTIHELLNNGKINLKESDRNRINLIVNKSVKYNERASMIYKYIEQYNKLPEDEKKGDIKQNVDANMEFLEEKILKDQEKSKLINTNLFDYLIKILNNNNAFKKNTVEYKEKKISMKNKIEELTDHFDNLGHIMKYNFQLIKDRQTKNVLRSTQQNLDYVQIERNKAEMGLYNTQQDLRNTQQDLDDGRERERARLFEENERREREEREERERERKISERNERERKERERNERERKERERVKTPILLESNRQRPKQNRQKEKRLILLKKRHRELIKEGNELESEQKTIGDARSSRWQKLDRQLIFIYDEQKNIVEEMERLRKTNV